MFNDDYSIEDEANSLGITVDEMIDIKKDYLLSQLQQLKKENLFDYYMYNIEKYNLDIHDSDYELHYDVLNGLYEERIEDYIDD